MTADDEAVAFVAVFCCVVDGDAVLCCVVEGAAVVRWVAEDVVD